MHRIERAVILAAGSGTRLRPLTIHTPKPLLTVHGVRIIASVIDALWFNGIHEIYIVVGYLAEEFETLKTEFPGVQLIVNPDCQNANNISSLYYAREHLHNTVILDGDQLIRNPAVFQPEFTRSGYFAVPNHGITPEWTLTVREGIIRRCVRGGGNDPLQLVSASVWSAKDGARLASDVQDAYCHGQRRDIYWDDVPLFLYPAHYQLGVREIAVGDMVEIDTLAELAALDASYLPCLTQTPSL